MSRYYDDEEAQVRADLGECTEAPDHEDVDGVCIHCGAEFDEVSE